MSWREFWTIVYVAFRDNPPNRIDLAIGCFVIGFIFGLEIARW